MSQVIEISDLAAPELAPYAGLTQAQLLSRRVPERALFIAESPKVIALALAAGCQPVSMLMARRHINAGGREIIARCGVPVYTADEEVLAGLTGFRLTRGMLCAMRRPAPLDMERVCAGARRIVVLEGIVDPTNVGAVFRSAAGMGMDGVLLTPTCCDPLHRRAARVSMGAVFQIPWARTGGDHTQWPRPGLDRLKALGFRTAALALEDRSVPIDHPALLSERRLAILLGTEGDGLAPGTVAACDYTVKIPMARGVDSLNVAAAGAVAFWQLRPRD